MTEAARNLHERSEPPRRRRNEVDVVWRFSSPLLSAQDKRAYEFLYGETQAGRQLAIVNSYVVGQDQGTTKGLDRINNLLDLKLAIEHEYRQERGPRKGQYKLQLVVGRDLIEVLRGLSPTLGPGDAQQFFEFHDGAQDLTSGPSDSHASGGGQAMGARASGVLRLVDPRDIEDTSGRQGPFARTVAAPDGRGFPLTAREAPPGATEPPAEPPPLLTPALTPEPPPSPTVGGGSLARAPLTLKTLTPKNLNNTSHLGLTSTSSVAGGTDAGADPGSVDPDEAELHRLFAARQREAQASRPERRADVAAVKTEGAIGQILPTVVAARFGPAAQQQQVAELVERWYYVLRDHRMFRAGLASLAWDVVEGRIPVKAVDASLTDTCAKARNRSSYFNGCIKVLRRRYGVTREDPDKGASP